MDNRFLGPNNYPGGSRFPWEVVGAAPARVRRSWGFGLATRWRSSKFIDLILNLQSDNAHNMLCLLLGESPLEPKRVLRLTFESDQPLPMDSTEKRHDWIAKADHIFTHNAARIAAFLSIERSSN